ncbi:chitin disaccharide deacetylase [Metabacillus sp. GX 13764]|uniref:chitin disaccharide deacetylase n=1 Tax=Metabacillus kandeliae TaxID=2900151 RepID=UPI001E53FB2D|nr:chitin disaccharide deacetylase [Metabacillus kandeliae]MCD7035062.1 chitin disaccharide deacetylase [Metabacillus kandeliae]
MKVIVNADDFGYSKSINYGILEAHENGILTSATMMMNMPGTNHACFIAKNTPSLGVGVHFALTIGEPLTVCPSLTDTSGQFLKRDRFFKGELNLEEVKRELSAQLSRFLEEGLTPTHFDSHHHVHSHPIVWQALTELADSMQVPVREPLSRDLPDQEKYTVCSFYSSFYGEKLLPNHFISLIEELDGKDAIEVMTHPGYADAFVMENSSYNVQRVYETKALLDPALKEWTAEKNIELCHYGHLKDRLLKKAL